MQPAKVDVAIYLFCYSGTSALEWNNARLTVWLVRAVQQLKADPRVGRVSCDPVDECPTDYARNKALAAARREGFDIVLMVDADNWPDARVGVYEGEVPFLDVAFPLIYDRLQEGKPTLVGAPYCTGPAFDPSSMAGEVPLVYCWEAAATRDETARFRLTQASRQEAALMGGLHRVPAIATGVCMFSTNIVDDVALPWFYYEYSDDYLKKESTEDIVFSRNVSMIWYERIKEHVCFLAADSWAYHFKGKWVGKPARMSMDQACKVYRDCVVSGVEKNEKLLDIGVKSAEALVEPTSEVYEPADRAEPAVEEEDKYLLREAKPEPLLMQISGANKWTNDVVGDTGVVDKKWAQLVGEVAHSQLQEPVEEDEIARRFGMPKEEWEEAVAVLDEMPVAESDESRRAEEPVAPAAGYGIGSILYGGRRIHHWLEHPLTQDHLTDLDGVLCDTARVNGSYRAVRMVVLNTGLGDSVAAFVQAAQLRGIALTLYCGPTADIAEQLVEANLDDGGNETIYVRKLDAAKLERLTGRQDLDLVWTGYPPDERTMHEQLMVIRPHVRAGGIVAGPAHEPIITVLEKMKVEYKWYNDATRLWYMRRPGRE